MRPAMPPGTPAAIPLAMVFVTLFNAFCMASVGIAFTCGVMAATANVGVETFVVLIAWSCGALICGACGVNCVCVKSTGCSAGGCTETSLDTSPPSEAEKSGCSICCLMSTTLPPTITITTWISREKVKNRDAARRS